MTPKGISVIIRTLNESKYLPSLLENIIRQKVDLPVEIVLVDSGSTDGTISIAKHFGCKIIWIKSRFLLLHFIQAIYARSNKNVCTFIRTDIKG